MLEFERHHQHRTSTYKRNAARRSSGTIVRTQCKRSVWAKEWLKCRWLMAKLPRAEANKQQSRCATPRFSATVTTSTTRMSPRSLCGATPAIVSFKGSAPLGSFGTDSSVYVDAYLESWPRLKISASSNGTQAARSSVDINLRKCKVDVFDTDVLFDDAGDAAPRIKAYWDEVHDVVLPKGGYSKLVRMKSLSKLRAS